MSPKQGVRAIPSHPRGASWKPPDLVFILAVSKESHAISLPLLQKGLRPFQELAVCSFTCSQLLLVNRPHEHEHG